MSTYKEINSDKLKFIEDGHKYLVGDEELTSVTTFIGTLFPKFDSKAMAKKIAEGFKQRNGAKWKKGEAITELERKKATQKYWIGEWKKSADYGTLVHNQIEDYCNEPTILTEKLEPMAKQAIKYLGYHGLDEVPYTLDDDLSDLNYEIHPEAKIYSEKWKLAGTIDLLAMKDDGTVIVGDWKTNKKFTTKPYNKGDRGLTTISKQLSHCKLNTYALQIMIYAYILKTEYDIDATHYHIIHLTDKGYNVYEIDYDEDLVLAILEEKIQNEN